MTSAAEAVAVLAWRAEQLLELGVPADAADGLAEIVDWHELAALVGRGCPLELALQILL